MLILAKANEAIKFSGASDIPYKPYRNFQTISYVYRISPSGYEAVGHEVILITDDLTLTNTINSYSVS